MRSLQAYYTEDVLRNVLVPIITNTDNNTRRVSLRALDWLVTNYAKKRPVIYKVKPQGMPERLVNVYTEYKTLLWKFRRAHFDPFRRRHRIRFKLDGVTYSTTVGQLNFMFWASRYGVLDYARAHITDIEHDHAKIVKIKTSENNKKRRQLSQSSHEKVFVFGEPVTVSFTPGRADDDGRTNDEFNTNK